MCDNTPKCGFNATDDDPPVISMCPVSDAPWTVVIAPASHNYPPGESVPTRDAYGPPLFCPVIGWGVRLDGDVVPLFMEPPNDMSVTNPSAYRQTYHYCGTDDDGTQYVQQHDIRVINRAAGELAEAARTGARRGGAGCETGRP